MKIPHRVSDKHRKNLKTGKRATTSVTKKQNGGDGSISQKPTSQYAILSPQNVKNITDSGISIQWYEDMTKDDRIQTNVTTSPEERSMVEKVREIYGDRPDEENAYTTLIRDYPPLAKLATSSSAGNKNNGVADKPAAACLGGSITWVEHEKQRLKLKTLTPGEALYKGMDYFYPPQDDLVACGNLVDSASWYSSARTAFTFAQIFHGGLHAYAVRSRDTGNGLRLLYMDVPNTRRCIALMRRLGGLDTEAELLSDLMCADESPSRCARRYLQLHRYDNELWLNKTYARDVFRGCGSSDMEGGDVMLMWGHTRYDKQVAVGLCALARSVGADGYYIPEVRTPFSSIFPGVSPEQAIICRASISIRRNTDDPLDWINWPETWKRNVPLAIPGFAPNKDMTYGKNKNRAFRMTRFYVDHPVNSAHNRVWMSFLHDVKTKTRFLVLATLNVHGFDSINARVTREDAVRHMFRFFREAAIDVACLQEVQGVSPHFLKTVAKKFGYGVFASGAPSFLGLVWKQCERFRVVTNLRLQAYTHAAPKRARILFEVHENETRHSQSLLFRGACTHLDIGRRFEVNSSVKNAREILSTLRTNAKIRATQLEELANDNADVIAGDMNIETWMPELGVLTARFYVPELLLSSSNDGGDVTPTSIYGGRVDYIAYRPGAFRHLHKAACVLDYPYSDHLPVVHVIGR